MQNEKNSDWAKSGGGLGGREGLISLSPLAFAINVSIISHKGFRSHTLKHIWLSFPREISPCCVIILSRNQRPFPAPDSVVLSIFVTLTYDWLVVA